MTHAEQVEQLRLAYELARKRWEVYKIYGHSDLRYQVALAGYRDALNEFAAVVLGPRSQEASGSRS